MFQTAKTKVIAVSLGAVLLSSLVAAGVMAASDQGGPRLSGLELTETPAASEPVELAETQEPTETDDPAEPVEAAGTPGDNGEPGVPLDSPACAGDLEHPNPHDTDGDGDGCREIRLPDGTVKNLPDPAADAHEGNPGHIGDLHGNGHDNGNGNNGNGPPAHAHTPGPPDGDPPHGHAFGHDEGHGRPTGEPPFGRGHGQGPYGNDGNEEDDDAGPTAAAP